MSRLILPALLTFALADGQTIATQYKAEQAYRIEVESAFTMETVDFSMERDGEPVEGGFGGGDMRSEQKRNVVMIDTVLEAKNGVPIQVRRAFQSVSCSTDTTMGERQMENELECPLDGVVIEMTLDDGEVVTELVEGEQPDDEAVLEGHKLTLALDALLPDGEVEAEKSWDIDGEALLRACGFDVEKALFPTPTREEGAGGGEGRGQGGRRGGGRGMRGGGGAEQYFASGDWKAEATLVSGTEEYDGVKCYVIQIEAEASGELPEREFGGRDREDRMFGATRAVALPENSFEIELEGKLYFSVEGGHPLHLELEGKLSTESVREMQRRESLMVITSAQEGTLNYTVDVKRVVIDGGDEE
jgi:hypothetical protein